MKISAGVETLTVTDAAPGARLRIDDQKGRPVATLVADAEGHAHLAFVPPEHRVLETLDELVAALADGEPLPPGTYTVTEEAPDGTTTTSDPFQILDVDDRPDASFYEQELPEGFGYLTVRDGVKLSVMVRFPDRNLYGDGPWPTVIEYSGYGPSDPDSPQPSSLLANLLGFAVVGVNIRGTGCSGGVYDVFSPAQSADGYDIVEIVANQPWVLHGRPGMVGLSYPGITQLYVASTRPPHLAAITPLSVIDDLWRQQWPGGIYNTGFTRAWLAARDQKNKSGGMAWDQRRIDEGDEVARDNQRIRTQNFDFERFGRAIEDYRPMLDARRIGLHVERIEVPVYLTGAWQDEQTGSRFATMIDAFTSSPRARAIVFNGHHPDGLSPMVALRWYEFLCFYVARRIPQLPEILRAMAPMMFQEYFGYEAVLEADRFLHHGDDFEAALAEYEAEPRIRMLFESGAAESVPGATGHRFEATADSFPPPGVEPRRWWLADGGALVDEAPAEETTASYVDDPEAGELAYSIELLTDLDRFTQPQVPITWTRFEDRHRVTLESGPLGEAVTVAGFGHVDLWLRPGTADTAVQATLTEIRPDGLEQRVQSGWHRPIHRAEDPAHSDELRVDYTFSPDDKVPLMPGEWLRFRLPLYPFAHVFRPDSRIRLTLSTPGRDHPFWCFDNPIEEDATHDVGLGGAHPSALVLPVWPEGVAHPADYPAPGSLRGQPTRPA